MLKSELLALGVKIDPSDEGWLDQFQFYIGGDDSIMCHTYENGRQVTSYLGRLIVSCPSGMVVDHINGDKKDNRRENLRVCTQQENLVNRCLGKNNTSGYRGVYWHNGMWVAEIKHRGVKFFLGRHETPEDAARAFNQKATELRGANARLNQV